jgi:hypothetical protein
MLLDAMFLPEVDPLGNVMYRNSIWPKFGLRPDCAVAVYLLNTTFDAVERPRSLGALSAAVQPSYYSPKFGRKGCLNKLSFFLVHVSRKLHRKTFATLIFAR